MKKKKNRLSQAKRDAKRTRIAGTVKHRKKKKAVTDVHHRTSQVRLSLSHSYARASFRNEYSFLVLYAKQHVKRAIDANIEDIMTSKVKLAGHRFIFGDLESKGKEKVKSLHGKRSKREAKKKRRFTMADKIEQELADLRRDL